MHAPTGLAPQEHNVEPLAGATFSVVEREQLQEPTARARHEHLGPLMVFSVAALAQVHLRAGFWPQEQRACIAQTHSAPEVLPQQVLGETIFELIRSSL